jgi:hypothetical protein
MTDSKITDLVPTSKKPSSKEITFRTEAQNWLDRMSLGVEKFSPLISSQKSQSLIAKSRFANALALWTYPTAPMGTFTGLATLISMGREFLLSELALVPLVLVGCTVGATALIGVPLSKLTQRKSRKKYAETHLINQQGLKNWLKARYGIEVNEEQMEELMKYPTLHANAYLYLRETSEYNIDFVDVDGRKWVFNTDKDKSEGWHVTPYKEKAVKKPIKSEQTTSLKEITEEVVLPGEANAIFGSISNRVAQLEQYSLETEASHNILRIVQDTREAIATYKKLDALGEADTGLADLVEVLSILNEELLAIVRKEASDVRNDLLIQKDYLRSRQLESGLNPKLGLQLDAPKVEKTEVSHD